MPTRINSKIPFRTKTFVRQWRDYRGLSQDQLVERVRERLDTFSKSTLSRIENAKQPYSQPILEAVAWALNCEVADLIMRDPTKPDAAWSIYDNLRKAPPDIQEQVAAVAEALLRRIGT